MTYVQRRKIDQQISWLNLLELIGLASNLNGLPSHKKKKIVLIFLNLLYTCIIFFYILKSMIKEYLS